MSELRLGDIIDDYCAKCRRLTNHAIVSLLGTEVAKVRCRSCYFEHDYLKEQAPPSKKDLKKQELFNAVLASSNPAGAPEAEAAPAPVAEDEPVPLSSEAEPPAPKKRGRTTKKA